jgi:signal transduction histidine kinase
MPIKKQEYLTPGKIAFIYLGVCTLWILLSDRVLLWMDVSSSQLTELQTVKGLAFVVFTTLLIYYLVKKSEDALQKAHEHISRAEKEKATVLDNVSEYVLFFTPDYKVRWANRPIRDKFHFTEREIKRYPMKEVWGLLQIDHPLSTSNSLAEQANKGYFEMNSKNHSSFLINDNPVYADDNSLLGMIEVIVDVTELKKMHIQREELLLKLQEKNKQLEEITQQLFHEMQTPLVTIGNYSKYLDETMGETETPEISRSLHAIQKATIALEKRIQAYAAQLRNRK